MLPALSSNAGSLADVVPSALRALGVPGVVGRWPLPRVDSVIVVVVDGLGRANLAARAGHARTLARAEGWTIHAAVPTTTATGLTTLTTGALAGAHGMLGYATLDPQSRTVRNNLTGEGSHTEPETWQPVPPLFALAREHGVRPAAVTDTKFQGSSFTRAKLRGADFLGGATFADRVDLALDVVRSSRSLVYLYTADVDHAGHQHGSESPQWTDQLEMADAEIARLAGSLPPRVGVLVVADHGMVDVPSHRHRIIDPSSAFLQHIDRVAGEPRFLQLYRAPGTSDTDWRATVERWRDAESERSWVATREELAATGVLGEWSAEHAARLGDLLVAARARVAYYLDAEDPARDMIGQHGSLTPEELRVPLLRLGAFA